MPFSLFMYCISPFLAKVVVLCELTSVIRIMDASCPIETVSIVYPTSTYNGTWKTDPSFKHAETYCYEFIGKKKDEATTASASSGKMSRGRVGYRFGKGTCLYYHGEYVESSCYDGEWDMDKWDGKGRYKFSNGEVYEGDWKQGVMHGHGKYTYLNGDVYEGEFQDGKKQGYGVYTVYDDYYYDGNGACYEGDWDNDVIYFDNGCFFHSSVQVPTIL